MPRARRTPIEYTQQFGAGIFRPKDAVDQELAELEDDTGGAVAARQGVPKQEPDGDPPPPRERTAPSRKNGRTFERTNERHRERIRVRHSFDVWQDQLHALTELQAHAFSATGRKPKLGELVQEALDAYIAKERKRTNVRTNERTE
jgi:hypothetical protein